MRKQKRFYKAELHLNTQIGQLNKKYNAFLYSSEKKLGMSEEEQGWFFFKCFAAGMMWADQLPPKDWLNSWTDEFQKKKALEKHLLQGAYVLYNKLNCETASR